MGSNEFESMLGSTMGAFAIIYIIALAVGIFSLVCMWKCFVKMGERGWASIVPFYNTWILCKHTWGHGAMMFTWLIPVVGSFLMLATYWKFYRGFGKSIGFCICGLLFTFITTAICAFDSSVYTDPV